MRLPETFALLEKDWRELWSARAFWLLLVIIGPLVGHSFITAVDLYSEVSGSNGAPAALPQGLTPLDGVLVPTWGAYDLAAMLLFPFVAIRLIAGEKENGALKLLLQLPGTLATKVSTKGVVLAIAWIISWVPALLAMLLWRSYGGHLYASETLALMSGYLLRGLLSAGLGVAAATLADSAASAAIITLSVTVGTWVLDFIAAGRGGLLQQLASFTPAAVLRNFEQGLVAANTVIVIFAISVAGFVLSAIWLHSGRTYKFRLAASACLLVLLVITCAGAARLGRSWDLSENHRNSFPPADELALREIRQPLLIQVFLSPEDPRLTDFEQNVLKKLRRIMPSMQIVYSSTSRSGLFDSEDHYGEIWYQIGDQKVMDRSTIEQVVLEQIYKIAGRSAPEPIEQKEFPGYPLAASPRWASLIFYGIWPLTIGGVWLIRRRRENT